MADTKQAILAFEDGTVFRGSGFGASKTVSGEAAFNTSMTGYQEILTDPSYSGQVLTMTTPQIGNYGVNASDMESDGVKLHGFVVRALSPITSSWRSEKSVCDFLKEFDIPGIEGVDTRAITKKLRESGAMKVCLSTEKISEADAILEAKNFEGLEGHDYVQKVTVKESYDWDVNHKETAPFAVPGTELIPPSHKRKEFQIAAIDFGAKLSIYRKLRYHGFKVKVFPASVSADEIKEFNPSGLFLSNGPGDPSAVKYAHEAVRELMQHYPTFGICLGHQIITHALGAKTFKLKFGHRGGNQPVKNLETGQVLITSQNHGFASTQEELERVGALVTEINLNDQTVEGLRHKELPVFSVQYHPEAAPGPNDADCYFKSFYDLVAAQ